MKFISLMVPVISQQSPPSRGAWIEIGKYHRPARISPSPPSRGAWIEINFHQRHIAAAGVAPLAGGVD